MTEILYNVVATNIGIKKSSLRPHEGSLIGFSGKHVPVEGSIRLRATIGTWLAVVGMDVDFLIVDALNIAYNAIIG